MNYIIKVLLGLLTLISYSVTAQEDLHQILLDSIRQADITEVEQVILRGIDLNFSQSISPLVLAVALSNEEIAQLLLENEADVNFVANQPNSPVSMAAESGDIDMLSLLYKYSPNLDDKNIFDYGHTPLMQAASKGRLKAVISLQKAGADLTAKDNYGDQVLAVAAYRGHLQVVEYLLQQGININHKNTSKSTALDAALGQRNNEVVQYLINAGAKRGKELSI